MKKIIALLFLTVFYSAAFSQSTIGKATYQKTDADAVINEFPFSEKTVSGSLEATMQKMGYKGKSSKGYMLYDAVNIPELGSETYKLYFSVNRKSRREKESSVVSMLISKNLDNFITTTSDPAVFENGKTFLNKLISNVQAYDLELQINDQQDVVKKNDKKASALISDADDLQKKKKKIEQQIEDNIKAQADQQDALKTQRKILETLIAKRKVLN